MKIHFLFPILLSLLIFFCSSTDSTVNKAGQSVYQDVPYLQDYAVKYPAELEGLHKVGADRNGVIQVLAADGLYNPYNGHLQIPGSLEQDRRYRPMKDKNVKDMIVYENQFVYLDDEAIFSNAWAGKLFSRHQMPTAKLFCGGPDFTFMISDGQSLALIHDSMKLWFDTVRDDHIQDLKYDALNQKYWVLTQKTLFVYSSQEKKLKSVFQDSKGSLTSFDVSQTSSKVYLGTDAGYYVLDTSGTLLEDLNEKLPWTELTAIREVNGQIWFGSTKGAFMLRNDGKFNYYYGRRWLPGDVVTHIAPEPEGSVLILTDMGLGQICFKEMTLEDKAMVYEKQVRQRHIRFGVNVNVSRLQDHNLSTAENWVADSDNLWTSMYLGSQIFRYLSTGSEEAKQNAYEAFEALERFHTINNIKGLFGRSFERRGYQDFHKEYRDYVNHYWYDEYQGTISWRHADDPEWDWRASASSDQTIGQIFAMTLIAEYIEDAEWRDRAVKILDDLMGYIVANDMCLIDYNGLPSLWGRWNPEYVNRFDTMIGDRKICSSNIVAFLQTAYHFTGKVIYKDKAFELMNEYGYLENLKRPFSEIGPAPEDADGWSKLLSEEWNHSDDEMYFLGYWGLYPYAFNDTLKAQYFDAIKDHWQMERPEKNPLWNFCYAITGAKEFDLDESVWTLKEFPLDLIQFANINSHRKDIEFVEKNFWGQTTTEVLPPDERPSLKHNRSWFTLDAGDRHHELSAGDTFLLPYWMGRYLGVISAPVSD